MKVLNENIILSKETNLNTEIEKSLEKIKNKLDIDKNDVINLLSIPRESPIVEDILNRADEVCREVTGNRGKVWAAIGIDYSSCKMNCKFCSLGDKWNHNKKSYELSEEQILSLADKFVKQGIDWLVLRTTEFFDIEKLVKYGKILNNRYGKDKDFILTANTGTDATIEAEKLKDAGFEMVYEAMRFREGDDTTFDVAEREKAMKNVISSGMILSQYLEPIGPEHTNEEIADRMEEILGIGTKVSGIMPRVAVEGTPKYELGEIDENRIAQITAIFRIFSKDKIEDMIIHPLTEKSLRCGANSLVVDIGAIPRDNTMYLDAWNGQDIEKSKEILLKNGFDVKVK